MVTLFRQKTLQDLANTIRANDQTLATSLVPQTGQISPQVRTQLRDLVNTMPQSGTRSPRLARAAVLVHTTQATNSIEAKE